MSRIEENQIKKNELSEKAKNIASWILFGFLTSVIVFVIVLVVVLIVEANKKDEEETEEDKYVEVYKDAVGEANNIITLDQLNNILDNDKKSGGLLKAKTYVFIYTSDFDTYDPDGDDEEVAPAAREDVQNIVKDAIAAFNAANDEGTAFYIVNLLQKDEDGNLYSQDFLSYYEIYVENGASLVIIDASKVEKDGFTEEIDAYKDIINDLTDAIDSLDK